MKTNIVALVAVTALMVAGAQAERIREPIQNHERVVLDGNTDGNLRREVRTAVEIGPVEPATLVRNIRMVLSSSAEQAASLEQLLEAQRDPYSPDYHNWLTPEQFGDRFGLSAEDLGKLTAWLQSQGFTIEQVARASNWITFSGAASQVATAFHTELRRYRVDGETHFANATDPSIPQAFAGVVSELRGLDDFRPKPMVRSILHPAYATLSGAHYLAPADLATIYDIAPLYTAGFDGTGQKIVIPGQTDISLADIRSFRSAFGLPAKDPQLVLVGPDPGVSSGDEVESDLDIEWAGAIARNATIIFVYSQNVFESIQYAIDQNLAPVISLSYGGCEIGVPTSYRSMAQQANAQGITWMTASGDSAAAGCDPQGASSSTKGPGVSFPANIPEVTAVGGTTFTEGAATYWNARTGAALSYIPETAWNDTGLGYGMEGSGGGASQVYAKPWWQAGPGVPADGARDVPDVALSASGAHDGYLIYAGSLMSVGGTSASSPSFAGIVSLLNQYVVAKGIQAKPGLGNINPTLYSLAQNTAGVFHDITTGDNMVPCVAKSPGCTSGTLGYKAGTGYDPVTGLGSVDAYNLVTKWASLPTSVGATMTLTANPASLASTASTQLTATLKPVTGPNAPTGNVAFTAGTVTLGSAPVNTGTAVLSVAGTSLSSGSNTITATYAPTGNFSTATASMNVTVTIPAPVATTTLLTASPTSIPASGTTQLTATVKGATGSITFTLGKTVLGTATLSSGAASIAIKGASLTVGSNVITAAYSPSGNFAASTGSVTVTVTSIGIATATSLAASPATLAATGTTTVTVTVKAASGSVAPTGTVALTAGTSALGNLALTAGTAAFTVKGLSLAPGGNTLLITYMPTGNFAPSSASTAITVTSAAITTTITATATPTSISPTGASALSITLKPASGSVPPTGTATFALGGTALGTATLSPAGSSATASFSVKASNLASGANNITVSYAGTPLFAGSTASLTVTVTPSASTPAKVAVTVTPNTAQQQPGWNITVQLQEQNGTATSVTGFTVNGADFASIIGNAFGATQLPAHGTLKANLAVQWRPMPANLTFAFSGTDTTGAKWTQSLTVATPASALSAK